MFLCSAEGGRQVETRVAVVAVIVQEGAGGDGAERSAAPVWKAYHWPDGRTLSHKESQHHQRGYGRAGRCGLGALRQAGAAPRRDPKTVYARRRRCKKRFRPPFSGPRASPAAAQTLAALPLGTVPQNTEKRSAVREPHDRVAVPGGRQPAGVLRLALHSPSPLPFFMISGNGSKLHFRRSRKWSGGVSSGEAPGRGLGKNKKKRNSS